MHLLDYQMDIMTRFLQAADHTLDDEQYNVILHTAQVNDDCMSIRTMMENARIEIRKDIKAPLESYKSILITRAKVAVEELEDVVRDGINAVNHYHGNLSAGGGTPTTDSMWEDYVSGVLAESNATAWIIYSNLIQTLIQLKGDLYSDLNSDISGMTVNSNFRLHETRLYPMIRYVSDRCSWCFNSSGTALMQIVKSRVQADVGASLYWDIYNAQSQLEAAYYYIKDVLVANETTTISNGEYSSYSSKMNTASSELQLAIDKVTSALDDADEALAMIHDLLHFTWELRCQAQLTKLVQEYEGSDKVATSLLTEMSDFLQVHTDTVNRLREEYMAGEHFSGKRWIEYRVYKHWLKHC